LFDSVFFSAIVAGYYPNQSSEVNGNLRAIGSASASLAAFISVAQAFTPGTGDKIVDLSLLQEAFKRKAHEWADESYE
jgi:hypothetical protein